MEVLCACYGCKLMIYKNNDLVEKGQSLPKDKWARCTEHTAPCLLEIEHWDQGR